MTALSSTELERYAEDGLLGPYHHPLIAEGNAFSKRVMQAVRRAHASLAYPGYPAHEVLPKRLASGMTWFKSAHLIVPELWEIAEHPSVLDRVMSILGPDVMWWGAQIVTKGPGDIHGWHYDTEYDLHDDGVLVWMGLDGLEPGSSLKAITRTHWHHRAPVAFAGGEYGKGFTGAGVLVDPQGVRDIAVALDPLSVLVESPMTTGDFLICHGHLWHGSKHEGSRERTALALSFSRPCADIRIPLSFDAKPIYHGERPTCVMLRGHAGDSAVNPIVARPDGR